MDAMCDELSIQPYKNGYISTGSDRIGGQAFWGIIAPLNAKGNNYTTCFEVVASFKNGTLNEHIVKTAQLLHAEFSYPAYYQITEHLSKAQTGLLRYIDVGQDL
jgi:hypothetical protein